MILVKAGGAEPIEMGLDDYVAHVVGREMPAAWPMDALKAQAVAARTYALATTKHRKDGYHVCTDSHCCQAYAANPDPRVRQAVRDTAGVIGLWNGGLKPTYYAAACGGRTDNSWGPSWMKARYCPCAKHGATQAGHKNGLCQYGARYLALAKYDWKAILDYYYHGMVWRDVREAPGVCDATNGSEER